MKLGDLEYFCNCMLKNHKEHVTAPDSDGNCCYCGYVAIKRPVTDADLRCALKHGDKLEELKREHLELLVKDRRYDEKVN